MCGSFLLIEAVRQLRPEGGAGQIADCETAIARMAMAACCRHRGR
jgi:hypothetical protein